MCIVCSKYGPNSLTRRDGDLGPAHFAAALQAQLDDQALSHGGRFDMGFASFDFPPADGIGDVKSFDPFPSAGLIGAGPDDAPNAIGPNVPTLTVQPVGGTTKTVGTIELNGDQDYRQVTLVAGKTYEIGMYGLASGPNLVPLADSYIELYDAAGNFVTAADGGAKTVANEANSGFDVLLTFTAEVSGTFYINARAYDNDPTDGTTGEGVGDYEVFAREADPNDPGTYKPYYDINSPLHALDWGSRLINKIHQTARNPDGDEGARPTGNAQGTPKPYDGPNQAPTTGNPGGFPNAPDMYDDPRVDSNGDGNPIGDATPLKFTVPGKNVITVYYAKEGETYKFDDPSQPGLTEVVPAAGFRPFEIDAMRNALAAYSDVADIVYIEVPQAYVPADPVNPNLGQRAFADLTILLYAGTPRTGLLGRHSPPDEGNEGQGEYNNLGPGWEQGKLVPGGFSFVTLVHELGHAHGLSHPHDTGGGSSILRGVEAEGVAFDYTTGDFDLNQAVNTIMSYEDGWPKSPYGNAPTNSGFGYQLGLSTFDIAVIQDKYGVNEEVRSGADVYVLPEANATAILNPDGTVKTKATGYLSIWDGGGIDEIRYDGARNANIDLRAATLKYEAGGGGWMSYTTGDTPVFAGFNIANGVVIENAVSGSGADTLRGNSAANLLNAGAGNDLLLFQDGGNDTGIGGDGDDGFIFGAAFTNADRVEGGAGALDQLGLQGNYLGLTFDADDMSGLEFLVLLSGTDTRFGAPGTESFDYNITMNDANVVSGQQFVVSFNTLKVGEDVTFNGAAEQDGNFLTYGGQGVDNLTGGQKDDGFFFGGDGRFGPGDKVNGQGGTLDQIGFQGNYSGASALVLSADALTNVELIVLLSAGDNRFGGGSASGFSYDITLSNGNAAAGQILYVSANTLKNNGTLNETLRLDGSAEQDGRLIVYGGDGNDVVIGGAGADDLAGRGGSDTLTGGGGADRFTFTNALGGGNVDAVTDFVTGLDLLVLDDAVFAGLATGSLSAGAFQVGTAATEGDDRIIYDPTTGALLFDADGAGGAAAVQFATLSTGLALSSADFLVI